MFATDLEKSDKAAVLAFAKTLLQITGNLNSFIYNKFDSVLAECITRQSSKTS